LGYFNKEYKMQVELFLDGEDKTIKLGELIGKNLPVPSLVYLEGDLGSGKTHLSKGIAAGLGITDEITSPTFTLINEYSCENINLYHLDLYRLDNLKQVLNLGIEDFIDNPESVVLFEWAEKLENYNFGGNILRIAIFHQDDGRRFIISSEHKNFKKTIGEINKFC
jgi:tRNA threonylcarbamoyladenosine biosynthesis protein TsaE